MSCRPPAPVCRLIVDPVGSGYVVSMARPGGNATGFISIEMSLIPKARACRDQWGRGVEGAIRPLARWSPRPHYRRCKNKKLSKATGSQGGEIHVGAIPGPRCRFITRQWRSLRSREYRARWQTDPGAWFGNNHYSHATTYTGVGHATLLSCAHPYKHGVVGNDWIDKKTKKRLYSTEDARHRYLDEETPQHSGTSPYNIKVTTVGDELRYATSKSKVIAISGKDRSAIGLAGQSGTAYMHSTNTGRFITSDYYMVDYPEWWKRFYAGKPQNKYYGQTWSLLLPEEAYARSTPDDRPWSTKAKNIGTRFPHATSGGANEPDKRYYDAMMWTPYGDSLTLDFVKAAIEGENLGNNPAGVPDILAISWTSHDYVNHMFGPESRQSHDQTVRLDRVFEEICSRTSTRAWD